MGLSLDELRNQISKVLSSPPERSITLHTGLRGKQTFEWYMHGGKERFHSRRPAKLVAIINYRHEVLDVNGEIWKFNVNSKGHVQYIRQCAVQFSKRERYTRFTDWEKSLL